MLLLTTWGFVSAGRLVESVAVSGSGSRAHHGGDELENGVLFIGALRRAAALAPGRGHPLRDRQGRVLLA